MHTLLGPLSGRGPKRTRVGTPISQDKMKTLSVRSHGAFMQFENGHESRTTFIDRASRGKSSSLLHTVVMISLAGKTRNFSRRENFSNQIMGKLFSFKKICCSHFSNCTISKERWNYFFPFCIYSNFYETKTLTINK